MRRITLALLVALGLALAGRAASGWATFDAFVPEVRNPASSPPATLHVTPSLTPSPSSTTTPTSTATPSPSATPTVTPSLTPTPDQLLYISDSAVTVIYTDGTGYKRLARHSNPETGLAWSPVDDLIAFTTGGQVWVTALEGYREWNVSPHPALDWRPLSWSPDGKRIVFFSTLDEETVRYVVNLDGSNLWLLGPASVSIVWSPDARYIAFACEYEGSEMVHVVDADGSNLRRIGTSSDSPSWSPDGAQLAFLAGQDQDKALYVVDVGVWSPRRLAAASGGHTWSPDGERIAFVAEHEGNAEIYVVASDGSALTNLTRSAAREHSPAWSPDGVHIAFISERDGNEELYVMRADGSEQTRLTRSAEPEGYPFWMPDGLRIAFRRDRPYNTHIIHADGSDEINLIPGSEPTYAVLWSPDKSQIAYIDYSGYPRLRTVDTDGSNRERDFGEADYPTWSSDGSGFAYAKGDWRYAGPPGPMMVHVSKPGTAAGRVTHSTGWKGWASWSYDGEKIVFATRSDGMLPMAGTSAYIMNANGSGKTPPAWYDEYALEFAPAWSPIDDRIALWTGHYMDCVEVDLTVTDGSLTGQHYLTFSPADNRQPDWSPDGSRIAFTSLKNVWSLGGGPNAAAIFVMQADGSAQKQLTFSGRDWSPVWSPDGGRIAFLSTRDGDQEIYVMQADGREQTRLTFSPGVDELPVWSPDGAQIAFLSARDGDVALYVTDADGANQRRLTTSCADCGAPAWSPDGSRLAYTAMEDGQKDIYLCNVDGSGRVRLTASPTDDLLPAWSPDSSQIAFLADTFGEDGYYESSSLHVIRVDGSEQRQVVSSFRSGYWLRRRAPSWSPDGALIAFLIRDSYEEVLHFVGIDGTGLHALAGVSHYNSDICWASTLDESRIAFNLWRPPTRGASRCGTIATIFADGSGLRQLTSEFRGPDLKYPWDYYPPSWSPDATRITFSWARDDNPEIYTVRDDGRALTRLTDDPAKDIGPTWSPVGDKIALISDRDGNDEIYTMNPDGSGLLNLTMTSAYEKHLIWSPDGRKIAFASQRDGDWEIYVMNADGGGQTRLTRSAGDDDSPAWSADGSQIAFVSQRDGNREIYVMNADGSGQRNVTNSPADDHSPSWRP